MATYTPTFQFKLPASTDLADIPGDYNPNFQKIDNLLNCLKDKHYISERSTNGKTRDVLKGKIIDKRCKGFEPILWEKRNLRNKKTSFGYRNRSNI